MIILDKEGKKIHSFKEGDIEVVIEMPVENYERDKNCVKDIIKIMNDELLLQMEK